MQQEKDAHISRISRITELLSPTSPRILRVPQNLRVLQVILDMVTVITMAVAQAPPVEVTVMAIVPAVVVMQIPTRVRQVVPLQIVGVSHQTQAVIPHLQMETRRAQPQIRPQLPLRSHQAVQTRAPQAAQTRTLQATQTRTHQTVVVSTRVPYQVAVLQVCQ